MFGFWKTWKALEARGIMGINRRNADYVLKYNKRSLYPIVDDKIITKERAIEAGIHVPELYGVFIKTLRERVPNSDKAICPYGVGGGRSNTVSNFTKCFVVTCAMPGVVMKSMSRPSSLK